MSIAQWISDDSEKDRNAWKKKCEEALQDLSEAESLDNNNCPK